MRRLKCTFLEIRSCTSSVVTVVHREANEEERREERGHRATEPELTDAENEVIEMAKNSRCRMPKGSVV